VLSFAPRLFVEDAAVGSSRASEVRVRIVTDSPIVALYFRSLLHRTPLYNPQAFPRTLTLYAATLAREGSGAGRGMTAPFTAVDCDPLKQRGHVLCVGPASLASLASALATAAGALQAGSGGYRSIPGGAHNPGLVEARAAGVLPWYMRDGHVYAAQGAPHPALVPLRGALVAAAGGGGTALVVGAAGAALEGAAARAGRLLAAHNCVWEAEGVGACAALWGGASLPTGAVKPVRGALVAQGTVTVPLCAPSRACSAPGRVLLVGGSSSAAQAGGGALEALAACAGLSAASKERLAGLKPSIELVGSAEEAIKALGL
jgi:hypothetical protein